MTLSTADKSNMRKWILMVVASVKSSTGVTIQRIKKFLDSKQVGISSKPEMKLTLKKLLETGHLGKKDGKFVIKKSRKKIPIKEKKRPKLSPKKSGRNLNYSKSVTKKPIQTEKNEN
ncbi:hypothetical protein HNY73_016553 [Argiope bruennichi]|uniref:H15 domain-containing protein n=1 Tax=Argiope bruennichi TaxID=94029 RepID=A0A8T0EK28_ARGBR|nr:hypothetical protein HNY73_016553 [Argiope bruennichi]